MKPFVYSLNGSASWRRGGTNIQYFRNQLKTKVRECAPDYEYDDENIPYFVYEDEESQTMFLSTFSFCYTFDQADDTVFFSYF